VSVFWYLEFCLIILTYDSFVRIIGFHWVCAWLDEISLMQQQFVITHWYTVLQKTGETWHIPNGHTHKHGMFLQKCKDKQLLVNIAFWQQVYLTQLSTNEGISVWGITWVTTNWTTWAIYLRTTLICLIRAIPLCYISMVYFNTILNTTICNYLKDVYTKSWQHVSVVHSTMIRP
jgi:hypothetical protein